MQSFVKKCRMFLEIKWTKTALLICWLFIALLIILLHLIILMLDERVGAIVTDSKICGEVGMDVLNENGSVVDAAIAILFCESVLLQHRVGIGGGFSAVIYTGRRIETIVATPRAPLDSKEGFPNVTNDYYSAGGSAVPGMLMGCWQMHRKFGILPWTRLLQPAIRLCEEGVPKEYVTQDQRRRTVVDKQRKMAMMRILEDRLNETDGEKIKFLVLAQTLRLFAKNGASVFYNGSVGEDLIEDSNEEDGVMTMADLRGYKVSWSHEPVTFRMPGNLKAYTTPLPTSGAIVALAINTIKGFSRSKSPIFWHQVIEAVKHAYGLSFNLADIENEENKDFVQLVRKTFNQMIDLDFAVHLREMVTEKCMQDHLGYYNVRHSSTFKSSTSSICITSPNGDAIVLTTDMLVRFEGTAFYSKRTGILLNNQMHSFMPIHTSVSESPNSFVRSGKRPLSSHCPVLVLNQQRAEVKFLVSASGDETAPAQVITALIQLGLKNRSAKNASNSFFFYPDIFSNKVLQQLPTTAVGTFEKISKFLQDLGHEVVPIKKYFPQAVRSIILQTTLKPEAEFTYREEGGTGVVRPKNKLNFFFMFIIVGISTTVIAVMCFEIVSKTKKDILQVQPQVNERTLNEQNVNV